MIGGRWIKRCAIGVATVAGCMAMGSAADQSMLKAMVTLSSPGGPEVHVLFAPDDDEVRKYQIAFLTDGCPDEDPPEYFRWFPPLADTRGLAGGGMFLYRYFPAGAFGLPLSCTVEIVMLHQDEVVSRTEVTLDQASGFWSSAAEDPHYLIADQVVERVRATDGSPADGVLVRILISNPTDLRVAVALASMGLGEDCSSDVRWNFNQVQSSYGLDRGMFQLEPMGWNVVTLPVIAPAGIDLAGCMATVAFEAMNTHNVSVNRKETAVELVPSGMYQRVGLH